jgi:hypothetical protein
MDLGPLVLEVDVDQAVIRTLRTWLPSYLSLLEDSRGFERGLLARPVEESFQNVLEEDEFPEGRLPAVTVTTAQTTDIHARSVSRFSADWRVIVSCVVRGRTATEARAVASAFNGATRLALVQQPDLGGLANGVQPVRTGVVPVDDVSGQDRYLAAGISEFVVSTDDVMDRDQGPLVVGPYPVPDPGSDPVSEDPIQVVDVTTTITERS